MPKRRSPGGWRRCGRFTNSLSAKGWPTATRPSRCAIRGRDRKLPHFLSTDEVGRLLTRRRPPRRWACATGRFWRRCIRPGLRVSEAVGMNDGDLDLAEGLVRIRGKGRRERLAPIGSFAAKALARWMQSADAVGQRTQGPADSRLHEQIRPAADDPQRPPDAAQVSKAHRASTCGRRRTRCGTALPRTSWIAAPTSAACRSCSATRAWSRRRSTRTSARRACGPCMRRRIRGRRRRRRLYNCRSWARRDAYPT